MLVNILLWGLFGLIAGLLAKFLLPGKDPGGSDLVGLIITSLLGLAGAVVGGYLASHLFKLNVEEFSLPGLAVAIGGAIVVLIIYRLLIGARMRR
jgi:uncharacterized membrane protein YeaQ/YmgE (transglycosylase-associated protein family)